MGVLRSLFTGKPDPIVEAATSKSLQPVFAGVDIDPGTLYGVQTLDEAMLWMQGIRRITRREAMTVPAVSKARNLIAGGLGQLPLRLHDQNNEVVDWSLLSQPEAGESSITTWTNVIDDLLFSKYSYLRVTHLGWHGKPAEVIRLDPESVTYRPDLHVYRTATGSGTAGEWKPDDQIIRIEGPNDPLLVAGARAIRALGRLEAAGLNAAEGVPPMDWFSPADGVDPYNLDDPDDQAEVRAILDAWKQARQERSTAYVPGALKYNTNSFNPEQLQLVQAREMAIGEIARLTGIDSDDLGLNTTSRVYFNAQDRRRAFLDFVVGPYMRAIESRLSMPDVTPRGYTVRFDTADFAKADDLTSAQTDEILVRSGVMDINEIRERRGLAPLSTPKSSTPALPAPVPEEALR
ncbi:phage portal protein [Nocardioides sp. Soil796]|uniref:phage portal protein n=1 Tax=Nocardioides sp. Soil796 TaxID=1736412 RepID=UPI00070DAA0A|nr:phage portal protein [Nocardioides sp. Soil796]KRF19656.1 hypothetical protein ASH02_24180 [Nocardioides sp. Soil796]